jgi:hypothetical protein
VSERKKKAVKETRPAPLSAMDRTRAVLSVWAERRKPSEVCRSLNVRWTVLRNWEDRALQGMLKALQPRARKDRAPALSDRLQKLLGREAEKGEGLQRRLHARLTTLQESKSGKEEKRAVDPPEPKKG